MKTMKDIDRKFTDFNCSKVFKYVELDNFFIDNGFEMKDDDKIKSFEKLYYNKNITEYIHLYVSEIQLYDSVEVIHILIYSFINGDKVEYSTQISIDMRTPISDIGNAIIPLIDDAADKFIEKIKNVKEGERKND